MDSNSGNILIEEIIEKCSKYMDFNKIIAEKFSTFAFLEKVALFLNGQYLTEDYIVKELDEKIDESKKIKILSEINGIFDKKLSLVDENIKNLFLFGLFDNLDYVNQNTLKNIVKNNTKKAITYYSVYAIINYECSPKQRIFEENYDPISEIVKLKNASKNKLKIFLMDLSKKKGLTINKENINKIMERIINV